MYTNKFEHKSQLTRLNTILSGFFSGIVPDTAVDAAAFAPFFFMGPLLADPSVSPGVLPASPAALRFGVAVFGASSGSASAAFLPGLTGVIRKKNGSSFASTAFWFFSSPSLACGSDCRASDSCLLCAPLIADVSLAWHHVQSHNTAPDSPHRNSEASQVPPPLPRGPHLLALAQCWTETQKDTLTRMPFFTGYL